MGEQSLGTSSLFLDDEWPDRLRRGVQRALQLCDIQGEQWLKHELDVHHIVAAGLSGAEPGRGLLSRWSISVQSVVNAAIVPRSFHQGQGLHRQEFLHTINLRLSSAAMFAEAVLPHGGFAAGRLIMLQTIQKIGIELVARSEDAAAIRLQGALQDLVTHSISMGGSTGGSRSDDGARPIVRSGRKRASQSGDGVRLASAAVPRSRRPCLQHVATGP